ncbi:MAG: hemolysin family protein, partial [Chloroflexia bacterium]
SLLLIRPLRFFMLLFRPFIWIINILTSAVLRMIGLPQDDVHASVYTVEELEMLVTSSRKAGVLDRDEEAILRRVFDFGDLTARQVMRPRTELIGVPSDATLSEVTQIMTRHRFSRFPVYDGDLDKIIGVLHVKDVFAFLAQVASGAGAAVHIGDGTTTVTSPLEGTRNVGFNVTALMRKIDAVPESLGVAELMSRMQQSSVQMIQVVDEYGGTAGVVTLEDIVEEIVGEVRDEFESNDSAGITVTPEGTLIDGLVAIDDVNDALGLNIESESDTLGGYVFDELGRKPEIGDEVARIGFVLRVEALDNPRIAKVRVLSHNKTHDHADQE